MQVERAVRPPAVVMKGVDAKYVLELAAADDQEPVEALGRRYSRACSRDPEPPAEYVHPTRHPLQPTDSEAHTTVPRLVPGPRRFRARVRNLKQHYGLAPLRVRGLERVALHADLVMLARLTQALSRARETVLLAA